MDFIERDKFYRTQNKNFEFGSNVSFLWFPFVGFV